MTDQHDETTAPAWETSPAPPAWLLEQLDPPSRLGEWRNVGPRRWRAEMVGDALFATDLLVLANEPSTGFMRHTIDRHDTGPAWTEQDLVDATFRHMQEELDYHALPECVAPGCTEKGVCLMVAAELGHLAGKVYAAGDEIRMCGKHTNDVYRAGTGLDQIAEWLRPDAEVLDPWAYSHIAYDHLTPEQGRRKYGRLPRMLRDVG